MRKGLSSDPRKNYVGFINVYLYENIELEIKLTRHKYFRELGKDFPSCVENFLKYEDAYLKQIAVYA